MTQEELTQAISSGKATVEEPQTSDTSKASTPDSASAPAPAPEPAQQVSLDQFIPILIALQSTVKSVSVPPTAIPQTFQDQIQFYDDGTTQAFYFYANNKWNKINTSSVNKFGGDGSDGPLTVSSGTTTIDLAGARYLLKQYSSISITGTGQVAFINPHANGTTVIFLCKGNKTVTSSATPPIDLRGIGAAGGTGGTANAGATQRGSGGGGGASVVNNGSDGSTAGGGPGGQHSGVKGNLASWFGTTFPGTPGDATPGVAGIGGISPGYVSNAAQFVRQLVVPGAGGGGGGGAAGEAGGKGGRGGGAFYCEVGGSLNITSNPDVSGTIGDPTSGNAGPGGGGAAGAFVLLYNVLIANTSTPVVTGGPGGIANSLGITLGGPGGGGLALIAQNVSFL